MEQKIKELTPELKLLLATAFLNPDDSETKNIKRLLSNDIDWLRFIHLSEMHGVLPRVYQNLGNINHPAVKDD